MMKTVYMDQCATGWPKHPRYLEVMDQIRNDPGIINHRSGIDMVRLGYELLDKLIAHFDIPSHFKIPYREIIFTRGATEGLNVAANLPSLPPSPVPGRQPFFVDSYAHNAQFAPHVEDFEFPLTNFQIMRDSFAVHPRPGTVVLFNLKNNFGMTPAHRFTEASIDLVSDCRVILDASQWIHWGSRISDLPIESLVSRGNEVILVFGFHKGLKLDSGFGILMRFSADGNGVDELLRAEIGGQGGLDAFTSLLDYSYSKFPSGTFDPRPYVALHAMLDHSEELRMPAVKDPEAVRLFDRIFQFMKSHDAHYDVNHDGPTSIASYWHEDRSLSELTSLLRDYLLQTEPDIEPIYRVGKFCCNLYFDYVVSRESNEKDGRIRISI